MLIISDNPFNLVKYHVSNGNEMGRKIKLLRSSSLPEVKEALLDGVDYDTDGEIISVCYLIYYTGNEVLKTFTQSAHNKTYLVVPSVDKWRSFINSHPDRTTLLNIKPSQYLTVMAGIEVTMEKETFAYFWSEYCIGKFDSNPYKWYNECRYLLSIYRETNKKFTPEDLDCILNKVTDKGKDYLTHMHTEHSKDKLLALSDSELFKVMIRAEKFKSLVEKNLEQYKPERLYIYYLFKQAFFDGVIRLREGAVLFDYLLNEESTTISKARNLFNIK